MAEPNKEPAAVTVRDIAKRLGVSASTVSRALSQPDKVSNARRLEIQRLADSLGYRPNLAARGLTTGQTKNIGVVVPDLDNPVFASLVKGAQARGRSWGYSVFVSDSEEDPRLETEFLRSFENRVDGIVLFSPRMSSEMIQEHAERLPTVLVNREVEAIPSLGVDDREAMRQAILHLRSLGHRLVGHISGPVGSWADRSRAEGLRLAIEETPDVQLAEFGRVAPAFSGGVAAADWVLDSGVTAVICYNDLVALGVLHRLTDRGVPVPERLSIIGFDGITAGSYVTPSLTTLAVPSQRMGRDAVDLLLAQLESPRATSPMHLPANLIVRESTGVASGLDRDRSRPLTHTLSR